MCPAPPTLRPGLAESYEISRRRPDLHLQAAPRRQVPQRPRDDGRGREILARPRDQPGHAVAGRGLLRLDRRVRGRRADGGLSGVEVVDPADRGDHAVAAPTRPSCMSWRSTSPSVVPKEAVEAAGADFGKKPVGTGAFKLAEWTLGQRLVFEKNADYWRAGRALSRQRRLRGRAGADRGPAAPAERRGRRPRRRHSAGQVHRGDGRPGAGRARRRGRPAAHRLHHAERQHPALRQRSRCARRSTWRSTRSGSSRSSTAARCRRPSRCRRSMPGYTEGLRGLCLRRRRRQDAAGRGRACRRLRDRALRR